MTLGKRIKKLREERNISQEKLSFDINISRQTISKWENDSVLPDSNSIGILCSYFNVTADYLINGVEIDKTIISKNKFKFDIKAIILLIIGIIVLVFGILFLTIESFKDSVKISTNSSFMDIPLGIILIILSFVIFIILGLNIVLNNKKEDDVNKN